LLVSSAKKGNKEAFSELIDMYADKIYSMCYYMSKNKSEADDLFQDVFLKAYKSISTFNQESKFSTWIYRITANHCMDKMRHYKKISFFSLDKEDSDEITFGSKIPSKLLNPEEEVQKKESDEELVKVIAKLSPPQKAAVLLKYFDEKPLIEIAEICNCSVGTVGSRLDLAMKKLRKLLRYKI